MLWQTSRQVSTGATLARCKSCHPSASEGRSSQASDARKFFTTGSELLYCVLSLSAKLYLGFFLLVNVIMTDGTVEGALSPADGQ